MKGPNPVKNYPFTPLVEIARAHYRPTSEEADVAVTDVSAVAQLLGYRWAKSTVLWWQEHGLMPRTADQVACELGRHIDIIWPERRAA